ncbi:MAG TPA: type II secretion system F family protein [Candidatus Saccharimonadales bacterium]|nr:type II secretion system F family protein [Candidatus Saccharimonadales bacterium]
MRFTYTATNKDGRTISGAAEASSKEALVANLTKQGVHPIIVKTDNSRSGGFNPFKRKKKVKLKDLVVFTRQLSTMISAGVPLTRCLSTLQSQSDSKYFAEVIAGITKDVEGGAPLADSFEKYPNVFSEVYINMVRAGEAGGILDEILKRLSNQVEQDSSMRKKIKSAMTYPIIILSITVVAFFGIMLFVIPKIGKILTDLGGPDAKLPIYTQAMLGLSNFLVAPSIIRIIPGVSAIPGVNHVPNAIFIVAALFIASIFFRRYIKTPKGKYQLHALLLRIPVLKGIIVKIAVARFSRTFASLMSAGVGVLDALEVTGDAIGNKVLQGELEEAAKEVKNGKQLSEPLSKSKFFPPIVSQMLAVGEETGQIDTILVKVADFYEEEVDVMIDGLSSLIEPLMIIVLGSFVGLIAASVMGPIASLSKNIGNN